MKDSSMKDINAEPIQMTIEQRPQWNVGWLPPHEVLVGIFGSSGSGKTHYLRKIIPMIAPKLVKYIHIASRITNNRVYDIVKSWCEQKNIKYSSSFELEDTKKEIENIINSKKDDEHVILIFDDFNNAGITDRTDKYSKISNDCFLKLRNYNVHMIYIVQAFTGMSAIARTNLNSYVIFRNTGEHSRRILAQDFNKLTGHSTEDFETLHNKITKIPHGYFCFTGDRIMIHYSTNSKKDFEEKEVIFKKEK